MWLENAVAARSLVVRSCLRKNRERGVGRGAAMREQGRESRGPRRRAGDDLEMVKDLSNDGF